MTTNTYDRLREALRLISERGDPTSRSIAQEALRRKEHKRQPRQRIDCCDCGCAIDVEALETAKWHLLKSRTHKRCATCDEKIAVRLPALDRYLEAVRLRLDGKAFKEIASHFGVSDPRARQLFDAGCRRLKHPSLRASQMAIELRRYQGLPAYDAPPEEDRASPYPDDFPTKNLPAGALTLLHMDKDTEIWFGGCTVSLDLSTVGGIRRASDAQLLRVPGVGVVGLAKLRALTST